MSIARALKAQLEKLAPEMRELVRKVNAIFDGEVPRRSKKKPPPIVN
jgi:hypothetical protein